PQSVEELVAAERGELRRIRPGPVAAPRDDDGDLVSLREEELRRQAPLVGGALQGREDVERNGGRRETVAPGGALRLHARQAVIERWAALHAEGDRAADAADEPHDLMVLGAFGGGPRSDWHEVHDLADTVGSQEAGQQDVRVREVHLAAPRV